ncbi:glycosyltransferase [Puniceicoccaceae bacterium K14]|nr:glycosyltransferase [Puniceicoccaceae bacterium K14]
MKVLHISHNLRGGAGKNLRRHHESLLDCGIDSRILIGEKWEESSRIRSLITHGWRSPFGENLSEKMGNRLLPMIGDNPFLNRRFLELEKHPWVEWADIVEIRQVHSGGKRPYLPLGIIGKIARRKPLVWRLSDMWAFTGYCSYSYECERWQSGCGSCPQLSEGGRFRAELKIPEKDSSRYQWNRKRKAYSSFPLTVVSPSRWMDSMVGRSFLGEQKRRIIPIGVEEGVYRQNREACRKRLGLEDDSIALLAILPNPNNHRKGYDLAIKVVKLLEQASDKLRLVVVSSKPIDCSFTTLPVIEAGFRSSDESLAEVYAACDILLFTSRADNSSQALVEAGMSGLAVAAFDVAGNPEYLSKGCKERMAPAENVEAMSALIREMVSNPESLRKLQEESRHEIRERFGQKRQTSAFVSLYSELSLPG